MPFCAHPSGEEGSPGGRHAGRQRKTGHLSERRPGRNRHVRAVVWNQSAAVLLVGCRRENPISHLGQIGASGKLYAAVHVSIDVKTLRPQGLPPQMCHSVDPLVLQGSQKGTLKALSFDT